MHHIKVPKRWCKTQYTKTRQYIPNVTCTQLDTNPKPQMSSIGKICSKKVEKAGTFLIDSVNILNRIFDKYYITLY